MIDRALMYSAARKQSRVFVQQVAGASRTANSTKPSPLPSATRRATSRKWSRPASPSFSRPRNKVSDSDVIDAAKRGLERSVAIVHAEMKRGLSALATIGSTARSSDSSERSSHFERFKASPRTRPPVSRPWPAVSPKRWSPPPSASRRRPAFGLTTTSRNKVGSLRRRDGNSSMELINYFILRRGAKK